MRAFCLTDGVQVSISGELVDSKVCGVCKQYNWSYQIRVRNFRQHPIVVTSHRLYLHDGIGQVLEQRDYGILADHQPRIPAGKDFACTRHMTSAADSSILYGYLRIDACGKMFSANLPVVHFESKFHHITQVLN